MAKYCGGYNALAGGQPAWAFRLFTGEIGVSYILRDRDPIAKRFFVMVNNQLLITNDEEQVFQDKTCGALVTKDSLCAVSLVDSVRRRRS